MAVLDARRPGNKLLLVGGFGATMLIHAGLLGAVWAGRAEAEAADSGRPAIGTLVEVQAVKFGKPRDLSFLPHKEAPPPAVKKPKLQLTQNADAAPRRRPAEKEERVPEDDPLKRTRAHLFKDLADPDATGTAEDVGDPNGLRGGTATVGKGPIYLQHLVAAVQNAWVVPTTIKDTALARLSAQACIKIAPDGRITEYTLSKPSGDSRFDATLLNALGSIGQFDPPTPDVKDIVTGEGVCLNFKKDRG